MKKELSLKFAEELDLLVENYLERGMFPADVIRELEASKLVALKRFLKKCSLNKIVPSKTMLNKLKKYTKG